MNPDFKIWTARAFLEKIRRAGKAIGWEK